MLQDRPGEFPDLQNVLSQLFCLLLLIDFFYSMVRGSYLSFGTPRNTLINMVPIKSVIRKCIPKMAHAPL
jgi:hypothetical protein